MLMREPAAAALIGIACDHAAMTTCCDGCGHYSCADCGLSFDESGEGGGPFEEPLYIEDPGPCE